jgi:hypothetical protein
MIFMARAACSVSGMGSTVPGADTGQLRNNPIRAREIRRILYATQSERKGC